MSRLANANTLEVQMSEVEQAKQIYQRLLSDFIKATLASLRCGWESGHLADLSKQLAVVRDQYLRLMQEHGCECKGNSCTTISNTYCAPRTIALNDGNDGYKYFAYVEIYRDGIPDYPGKSHAIGFFPTKAQAIAAASLLAENIKDSLIQN